MPRTSQPSALQTRVGRRFLALFLVAAIVPVCTLAVLTWREVRSQLQRDARAQLRDESKRLALDIVGRLQHAAREAHDIATLPTLHLSQSPDAMIDQVGVLSLDGQRVLGGDTPWEALAPAQPRLLQAGSAILLHPGGATSELWVAVLSSPGSSTLIAGRIRTSRLFDDAIEQTLPQTTTVFIADGDGRHLHADGEASWPGIPADMSGLLGWDDHGRWVGAYFKPPLAALYGVDPWTVAVARREDDVYAPVSGFLRQFLLVVAFTIGVVGLASLVQMRRQLSPLQALRDGTQQLAQRNFSTPIVVRSGDEFEDLADSFDSMRRSLRQTFDTLESRSEIDRAVLSSLDTHRIATTVVSSIARVVPSSAVASLIVNDDGTSTITVWRATHGGPPLTIAGGRIDGAGLDTPGEWSAEHRSAAPPAVRSLFGDAAARLLTVPVPIDGQLAAVLALERTTGEPFEPEHLEAVRQVGQQVAIALTNARLVQRLERLNLGTLNALARTIDAKSPWTAGHSERVTAYGVALATRLGLDAATVATMRRGGLLHDIGKIAIPSHILDKPGALTPDEMAIVKRHPEVGARILEPISEYATAVPIVLEHHERWDGAGYPFGLQGEAISLGGRIFALADVFDALTSDRPYRRGWTIDAVAALFVRETGRHFDPSLAPLFVEMMPELHALEVAAAPHQLHSDARSA